ncbi:hypothetical protein [Desulfobacter postgatei]|uniref:hypothetical protein n=1 Tax=Desulfobacter postgatei TaxID=2293 RepID=UPI00259B2BC3|nr:hypothetical protein [uncultured Desulfobacter sp.]
MKMLCITGVSEPDLIQIEERFCQAGMAASLSIERNGKQLNMRQWHDRFCDDALMAEEMPSIGKFGEQLASEIFFSNMDSFWGWADNRSVHLLDFWGDFDPRIVFVLTCCSLEHYLARLMENRDAASLDLEVLVSQWHQCHAHLLHFYHAHPERCLLVEIHDCAAHFNVLIQACRDKWDLSLTGIPEPGPEPYPFPVPLARHIAAGFTGPLKEAESLWNEIKSTVSTLTPDTPESSDTTAPGHVSFSHVVQSYQTLKDRSAEFRRISDLEEQLEDKAGRVRVFEEQTSTLQKELGEKESRFKDLEQKSREASEENKLILLQLHQVQEELESMLLKKQEVEQQWGEQQKKLKADLNGKDQQLKQREEQISILEKQLKEGAEKLTQQQQAAAKKDRDLDQLKKELGEKEIRFKDLEHKNQEINEENELILQQLHQVQEELESIFLKKQETEHQFSALQKELGQKETRFKDLEQKNQAVNKEKEQTLLQLQSLRDEHKKNMRESEQRLYELHEAQEKLAHYLIRYQEQTKRLEMAEARWERLLKRMPDYLDYGDVRIIRGQDGTGLICEVRDLEVGAQTYPELAFETFLVGGFAGFRFKHPDHITQRDLIPVAQTSEEAKKQSKLFKSLSTSEWDLLHATAHFLKTCLKTEPFEEETVPASLVQKTLKGLDRFCEVIAGFPQTLRFDEVNINEKTLSKDCEYLEICLENLSCGDFAAPEFVFRLSCAGLQSFDFGSNPRLEFSEETGTILKNWFDSSNNPDDPRLELRFALPEAMDLEVWNQLSGEDAEFIRMLISHLPALVEGNATSSGQEESKWSAVARNVEQIFKRRTQVEEDQPA